jgi:alpha-ketoglutarate-dependent taurine dioxygenase
VSSVDGVSLHPHASTPGRLLRVASPDAPEVELAPWLRAHRAFVEENLYTHGAMLFRGFRVAMPDDFRDVAGAAADLIDYVYRSTPRSNVMAQVYTSTEYPADQFIPPHCEEAYQRDWPMKLIFGCQIAAESGGATPLVDVVRVTARIDAAVREEFAERGVMYVRNYGGGADLPWQTVFQTDDRTEAERFCAENGIEVEWLPNDTLRTRQVCQGMATHPVTKDRVWFNQAQLFHVSNLAPELREALLTLFDPASLPRNAYFGDGAEIGEDVLAHVRAAFEAATIAFPWQQGDVLVLDNMLVAHAREPYRGPRRILTAMGDRHSALAARAA